MLSYECKWCGQQGFHKCAKNPNPYFDGIACDHSCHMMKPKEHGTVCPNCKCIEWRKEENGKIVIQPL